MIILLLWNWNTWNDCWSFIIVDSTYIQQLESQVQQLEKEKTDLQVNILKIE